MFRFPFGTVQELNLDWFLEQWEIFKTQAREAFEGIDHALDDEIDRVENAMTDLYAARDAAIAAKNAAETAEGSTLGYAQSAANSAASAAGSAAGSASSASSSAGSAESAAQSAQTSAQQASSAATSAGNAATSAGNAASNAGIARTASQESAAWATGSYTGDPDLYPVPSDAPQHENNAKYYAESISGDAASAAASASDAADSATAAAASASDAATAAAGVSASVEQIATNTSDIADLQSAVADLDTATEDLFAVDTKTGAFVRFNTTKTDTEVDLKLDIPFSSTAISSIIARHIGKSLLDDISWVSDHQLNGSGELETIANRWTTDYIDVSNYDTLYFMLHDSWSASWRLRVWTYDENKNPLQQLVSTALSGLYDRVFTLSVTNAKFLRFCIAATRGENFPKCALTDKYDGTNISLPEQFYGGTVDFTNGVIKSLYDANGDLLDPPIEQEFTYNQLYPFNGDNGYACYNSTRSGAWSFGSLTVIYSLTPQSYEDERAKMLKAIIAPVLPDMVTPSALAVNSFRIVNYTLYRITAAISAGGTLTPGTNCAATTIAAEITSILNS